jgi:hypothetical protein
MRISTTRIVAVVALLGAPLAGCGSSTANRSDGGGGGTGTACADYAQKYCQRLQACAPGILAIDGFTSVAECTAYYQPGCNDALVAPHTGDTAALVQQCGDEVASLSCTDLLQGGAFPAACLPRGGTIPNGGSCNSNWQCASARCSEPAVFLYGSFACGTCVPAVPLGQPCDPDGLLGSVCADNLVCAVTTAGATTPVCTTSLAVGAACLDTAVCPTNAYCDGTTHLCVQLPAVGHTCDPTSVYFCDPTKAAAFCDDTTSLCKAITVAKAGDACDGLSDDTSLSCLGVCGTAADAGQDAGLGTCSPFVFEAQPCTAADVCVPTTSCTGGVCTAPVCNGEGAPGNDAATNAGPPARRAPARRNLSRMPGAPLPAPAYWPRH